MKNECQPLSRQFTRTPSRSGLTLMELVVAMGLSIALMTLIGNALQFYAVTLNQRDREVRQAAIARAVMTMISADLRSCVWSEPQDLSILEDMLTKAASGGLGQIAGLPTTDPATDPAMADAAPVEETETVEEDLALSFSMTSRPGLLGTESQIQFDVSRLPRIDQMVISLNSNPSVIQDIPSDLKTVCYYVQAEGAGGVAPPLAAVSGEPPQAGLVRRVLDREASKYVFQTGDTTRLMQTGSLIAPEVTGLAFSYWDGMLWQTSWHSDDVTSLPIAIKIQITMLAPEATSADVVPTAPVYETIVRLPMATSAIAPPAEETTTTETTSADSTGTSANSSTSPPPGGNP